MAVVSGLLEVVVILWRSVEKVLKDNKEAQKYTVAKFGNVMAKYFQAFEVLQPPTVLFFFHQLSVTVKLPYFVFPRTSAVPFLSYSWPHSCPRLQFPRSGELQPHRLVLSFRCCCCFRCLKPVSLSLSSRSQLWRPVQAEEDGLGSSASAVRPAVRLHVQLGPGR